MESFTSPHLDKIRQMNASSGHLKKAQHCSPSANFKNVGITSSTETKKTAMVLHMDSIFMARSAEHIGCQKQIIAHDLIARLLVPVVGRNPCRRWCNTRTS